MRTPRWVPSLSALLDAKAEQLREVTASHGLNRYAEGYHDGYKAAAEAAGIYVRSTQPELCNYLGVCREPKGHDLPHVVRDASP